MCSCQIWRVGAANGCPRSPLPPHSSWRPTGCARFCPRRPRRRTAPTRCPLRGRKGPSPLARRSAHAHVGAYRLEGSADAPQHLRDDAARARRAFRRHRDRARRSVGEIAHGPCPSPHPRPARRTQAMCVASSLTTQSLCSMTCRRAPRPGRTRAARGRERAAPRRVGDDVRFRRGERARPAWAAGRETHERGRVGESGETRTGSPRDGLSPAGPHAIGRRSRRRSSRPAHRLPSGGQTGSAMSRTCRAGRRERRAHRQAVARVVRLDPARAPVGRGHAGFQIDSGRRRPRRRDSGSTRATPAAVDQEIAARLERQHPPRRPVPSGCRRHRRDRAHGNARSPTGREARSSAEPRPHATPYAMRRTLRAVERERRPQGIAHRAYARRRPGRR